MIFNSLGPNYSWRFAFKFLFKRGRTQDSQELIRRLEEKYQGEAWLYYRGRAALSEAIRLCQADYVVINSFSCYAVEQAIKAADSQVIFADIDKNNLNFGLKQLKQLHQANKHIKAVIIQNTFGIGPAIKPILDYCRQHKIYLIEDLAHCLSGRYEDGLDFGRVGDLVVLSFGRDKQIDVVNGGALIIRRFELGDEFIAPQALTGHWYQRFSDRLYPCLSSLVRACYSWYLGGQICHRILSRLGLLTSSSDGQLLRQRSLPDYRSSFIIDQIDQLTENQSRSRQLIKTYQRILPPSKIDLKSHALIRYPLLLTSIAERKLLLKALVRAKFNLQDTWYDSLVYPVRFTRRSAYKPGSCLQKEEVVKTIINLPLHRRMTVAKAESLAKIIKRYYTFSWQSDLTAQQWQACRDQFDSTQYNLLTSWEELGATTNCGSRVWSLALYKDKKIVALAMASLVKAKRGRFLKLAGNPIFKSEDRQIKVMVLKRLKALAKKHKCAFIRLQPYILESLQHRQTMKSLTLRPSPVDLNAAHTFKIDLRQPVADILAKSEYKKTRYYIKRAQKQGLQVVEDNTQKGLQGFLTLLRQTQIRQQFVAVPIKFIEAQFKTYSKTKNVHIYHVFRSADSKDQKEILATAFMVDSGSERAYLYGASIPAGHRVYASYLLQWQAILDAREKGLTTYNLWGVAPPNASAKHRFAGLTSFKKKFGGQRYHYSASYDLVLNPWRYWPLYWWEKFEAKRRHL